MKVIMYRQRLLLPGEERKGQFHSAAEVLAKCTAQGRIPVRVGITVVGYVENFHQSGNDVIGEYTKLDEGIILE